MLINHFIQIFIFNLLKEFFYKKYNINKIKKLYFYWGLGIGDWGLGIGDWAQSPIPNPQSPIPNPQSPLIRNYLIYSILKKLLLILN